MYIQSREKVNEQTARQIDTNVEPRAHAITRIHENVFPTIMTSIILEMDSSTDYGILFLKLY